MGSAASVNCAEVEDHFQSVPFPQTEVFASRRQERSSSMLSEEAIRQHKSLHSSPMLKPEVDFDLDGTSG